MSIMSTWQANVVLYLFVNVTFLQCYKLAVQNARRDGSVTVLIQAIAGVSGLLLVPLFPWKLPNEGETILLLFVASVFYAINNRLQTTVRKNLEVSSYSVLGQLGTVFVMFYGLSIFQEPVIFMRMLGATLIIGSNVWLFYKPGNRNSLNRYYYFAIFALFMFATGRIIDIGISDAFNLPLYVSLTLLIPAALGSLAEKVTYHQMQKEWKRSNKKFLLMTAFTWPLAILFSLRSYQYGEVNVVAPIQAISVMLNVLIAYLFFGERSKPRKKATGAFGSFLGVLGVNTS